MHDAILQLIYWINEARKTAANFAAIGLCAEANAWERAANDRHAMLERVYLAPLDTFAGHKPGRVAGLVSETLAAYRKELEYSA